MRTTLNIDSSLLKEVVKQTGEKSKGKAVDRAMEDFLRRKAVERLVAARGSFPDLVDKTDNWEEEEMMQEKERKRDRN